MSRKYPKAEYQHLIPYLDDLFDTISVSSRKHYYNNLVLLALYLEKHHGKGLLEANGLELKRFFKSEIDPRPIKKATKKFYRNIISSYYEEVRRIKKDLENDLSFTNPVPSLKSIGFSGKDQPLELIQREKLLKKEDVRQILEHIYFVEEHKYKFYAAALIILSGARVREVCQIKLEKLSLEDCWFITEVKSLRTHKRDGIYFFPLFFKNPLSNYIETLRTKYGTPKYLFPSPKTESHISKRTIQDAFLNAKRALGIKKKASPHPFRGFLNTKRYEQGVPDPDLKFLLNHSQGETYARNYLDNRKNREKLRTIYNDSNPFSKEILPSLLFENPLF